MLALELQRLAHVDLSDFIMGIVNFCQGLLGLFDAGRLQLREFETAFAVEFVLDDVFGGLSHGISCRLRGDQLSLEWVRRTMRIL